MTTVVIMPGGFHPFHAGHLALYQAAQRAFPDAEVYVAATNDTSERPFPFVIKEKLAQLAGVEPGHFVQVRSPFRADEITAKFDPNKDTLIFVRSEKDAALPPRAGGVKKDGSPSYLQPLLGANKLEPFAKHAYMAYLPTVEFGPGMTSATQIRQAWPQLDDRRKMALVMSLYPRTQGNKKLAQTVIKMLDNAIVAESVNPITANTAGAGAGMTSTMSRRYNQPVDEDKTLDPIPSAVIDFYQPLVTDVYKQPVDNYVDQARELLQKTDNPSLRKKLIDIFRVGNKNPYIQGGIITTVGAVLAGGVLSSTQKLGMSPAQTNLVLQAILNTVIPTLVSRVNGRNWKDTIKYTLASAGVGTGIAGAALLEDPDYIEEKWSAKYKRSIDCANPKGFSQRAHCASRKKNEDVAEGSMRGLRLEPMSSQSQRAIQRQQGQRPTSPQRLFAELADMLHVSVKQLTWLSQKIPGFPPVHGRGSSTHGGKGYYDLAAFKRWVIDNNVREKIAAWRNQGQSRQQVDEKCWDTHRQAGMKRKGNRMVPNCVPKESQ